MAELDWLQHNLVPVKEVLAKLNVKEESPIEGFVKELKKLPKRTSMEFNISGEDEQKKAVGRLNQLFLKYKLTGKFSVRKDPEAGMVYLYKRLGSKRGAK